MVTILVCHDSTVALAVPTAYLWSGITCHWLSPRLQSCVINNWALHYRSSATAHATVE